MFIVNLKHFKHLVFYIYLPIVIWVFKILFMLMIIEITEHSFSFNLFLKKKNFKEYF